MPRPPSTQQHARFSPSAAGRWVHCVASIRLAEQLRAQPDYVEPPGGDAANLGRDLHAVSEGLLMCSSDECRNGLEIMNQEHRPLIEPYVQHVRGLVDQITELSGCRPALSVEAHLRTGIADVWGTTDAIIINEATREAWIVDLKTGHQRVDAGYNHQLMIYALGVYRVLPSEIRDHYVFHLQIVQPRDEEQPIKSWTIDAASLLQLRTQIRAAVNAVDTAQPVLGDWCTYCPAAANCPAMNSRTLSVFSGDGSTTITATTNLTPLNPVTLTPEQISFFLTHAAKIEAFLEACKTRALHEPIPGFKVVEARTRRRWQDHEAVVSALLAQNRQDLVRQQPATIGDVEHALGRGDPIMAYAVAPAGAPSVVPESDPRPALDRGRVFDRIEEGERA